MRRSEHPSVSEGLGAGESWRRIRGGGGAWPPHSRDYLERSQASEPLGELHENSRF